MGAQAILVEASWFGPPSLKLFVAGASSRSERTASRLTRRPPVVAMAEDDEPTFETGDAGAADTYPLQAGEIRKGSHLMIKGNPCKCVEVSTSKTGKHGHAKAHIVAIDIFTGKKMEELCPCSHNLSVPFVKRDEYTLMDIGGDGIVSLLDADGNAKEDLNLPTVVKVGEPTDDDKKVADQMKDDLEAGKSVTVIVLKACGEEKIVAVRSTD